MAGAKNSNLSVIVAAIFSESLISIKGIVREKDYAICSAFRIGSFFKENSFA
jgi:UDP-N-acetylglucosamine enolpyruvyl transferase